MCFPPPFMFYFELAEIILFPFHPSPVLRPPSFSSILVVKVKNSTYILYITKSKGHHVFTTVLSMGTLECINHDRSFPSDKLVSSKTSFAPCFILPLLFLLLLLITKHHLFRFNHCLPNVFAHRSFFSAW